MSDFSSKNDSVISAHDNPQKIKVLRIIARMNVGGPAIQVTGLMQKMNSEIFDQKLVTGYVSDKEADYLLVKEIKLSELRIEGLGRSVNLYSDFLAFIKLIRLVNRFKPEIIHTHTAKAGVLGRLSWITLGYKPKLVHTFHGHLLHGYFGQTKTKLLILIERLLGYITNQFFAVGEKVANELIAAKIAPSRRFKVMPPGLEIKNIPSRSDILIKYNLDPNYFYCTFLGRVTAIKNPNRFLSLAESFAGRNDKIRFLLVGDGELLENCRQVIREKKLPAITLGWIANVEEVLAITDLMILTSDNEGMPLSLIQAGMAGIPAVATNVGSVSEVVINNQTGFVTDKEVSSMANGIERLISDNVLYDQFSKTAHEYCLSHFSLDRLVSDHENIYQALISN